jgi:hypothetical protein
MSEWEVVRHQVAIAGKVTDALTGKGISNVQVSVSSSHGEINLETAVDGHFHLLDLPNGSYSLAAAATWPGSPYGTAATTAVVTRDGSGNIQMASADIQLARAN